MPALPQNSRFSHRPHPARPGPSPRRIAAGVRAFPVGGRPRRDARPHLRAQAGGPGARGSRLRAGEAGGGAVRQTRDQRLALLWRKTPRCTRGPGRRSTASPRRPRNTVRHAGAANAGLGVGHANGDVTLAISDDGAGFDPTVVSPGHLGLKSMRERAELLGGTLEIESGTERGTRVRVRISSPSRVDPTGPTPSG